MVEVLSRSQSAGYYHHYSEAWGWQHHGTGVSLRETGLVLKKTSFGLRMGGR